MSFFFLSHSLCFFFVEFLLRWSVHGVLTALGVLSNTIEMQVCIFSVALLCKGETLALSYLLMFEETVLKIIPWLPRLMLSWIIHLGLVDTGPFIVSRLYNCPGNGCEWYKLRCTSSQQGPALPDATAGLGSVCMSTGCWKKALIGQGVTMLRSVIASKQMRIESRYYH